jgi:tripartite-type tricarboxylate transporter receptor subunit TctC
LVESGRLRALAIKSKARSPLLPDVPTLAEAGVRNAEYFFWVGLLVSSKTSPLLVGKLNEIVGRILNAPAMRNGFETIGLSPLVMTPNEFDEMMRREVHDYAPIIKAGKGNI